MDDRRSERFGRYEILSELGRGAMGVVYKARDPKINRVVAVKTISLAGQSPEEEIEYRERFFREAEAAGRLSHPGIVTIFDVGEEPDTHAPYIVMEYVGGQSLDHLLSQDGRKLPVGTALQLALELAEALDCAHGQGVVHRDLKPANVLLTEDGHAKIADFGVAKLNLANHTLAGRALGTPAYMSPEQLNGETVDGRSDLFSLGVVLYTVLTGYRPFQGNSALTVSFKVVNREPIAATLLNTELPPGLDYVISRAMAKDPAERYQRGMEMVLDIQELREGREPWSKAKTPASATSKGTPHTANEKAGRPLGQPWVAAQLLSTARSLSVQPGAAASPPEKRRKKSVVASLVVLALFVFGLGLWMIAFAPQGVLPRAAGPPPRAIAAAPNQIASIETAPIQTTTIQTTPIKTTPIKTEPAQPVSEVAAPTAIVSTPIVKDIPKTVAVKRTQAPTPNLARANSRIASPVASPAVSPAAPPAASAATLVIEVDHKFAEAKLTVWVDDRLTYTHMLEGTDRKHLVVFHRVQGHELHAIQLPAGRHRLRVEVTPGGGVADQSATVAGEFTSGQENLLQVNFDKSGEMQLSLQN
jgi:eukaryotic-like serine/threonine-protein kinase